jgi:hypothetical protein
MPTAMIDEELLRLHQHGGVLPAPKPVKASVGPDGQPAKDPKIGELVFTPRAPPCAKSMMKALDGRKQLEARHESQHWESCGKQVTSKRASRPVFSFGQKTRYFKDVRCREICQHPATKNPGPEYNLLREQCPTSVLRGFGSEKRFLEDTGSPRPIVQTGKNVVAEPKKPQIVHSTQASIFLATYPYAEPPTIDTTSAEEKEKQKQKLAALGVTPRLAAVTEPDLNHQFCKYKSAQKYSFGSSCIGHRFAQGTNFSKQPAIPQHAPRISFREQRERIAQPALKDPPAPAEVPAPAVEG